MENSKDNSIIIGGGPFLVTTNENGTITRNFGWASLHINQLKDFTVINILCDNRSENISDLLVYRFKIKNKITSDIIEDIIINLQVGYNTLFSYNFSKLDSFKRCCESYFINLDYKLSNKLD